MLVEIVAKQLAVDLTGRGLIRTPVTLPSVDRPQKSALDKTRTPGLIVPSQVERPKSYSDLVAVAPS